jgi:serine/threonine-protein kinase RsbW
MEQPFEMTIRSDIAAIPDVSARLEAAMQAAAFSPEDILDTQLAVEEAITNVIVHGYRQPGGEIAVSCRTGEDRVEVRIADAAPRFDPLSLTEPDLEGTAEERKIGGLGVYLIRQVMDEISYRYEDNKNILILTKKRAK